VVGVFGVSLVLFPTRCGRFVGSDVEVVGARDMSIVMSCVCERACCCVVGFALFVCAAVVVLVWGAVSFLGACQKTCVVCLVLPLHF
jgi:hypothetical protein